MRAQGPTQALVRAGVRREHTLDDTIRSDEIAWLTPEEAQGPLAGAVEHFTALMGAINEAAWLGLRRFDLMLSRYRPGAKYVRHLDAFPGQENRRVTAIVYLNEAWALADGGQLRLCVDPPVLVDPVMDRLVVFRSELVEHEVLEAHAERFALTAFFSAH